MRQAALHLAVAVVVCAVALVAADGEGVFALQGEEADMPFGWTHQRARLGEGAGIPVTQLSSVTSFSGTASKGSFEYKLIAGGKASAGLKELKGEELLGDSVDEAEHAARVTVSALQAGLENEADMMGKVNRMTAVKVLLSMQGARTVEADEEAMEAMSLVQVDAGVEWGRRRRGSPWEQSKEAQQVKAGQKKVAKEELSKATGAPSSGPRPPPKTIVKKAPQEQEPMLSKDAQPGNVMDEAAVKAEKAIELANEENQKAQEKADKEAAAAEKEANDKKAFELAEKRKHEVTNKQEKLREQEMKKETEQSTKKAKEAEIKAQRLIKALKVAKEASRKSQKVERDFKKKKLASGAAKRSVNLNKAKEKASKTTKEIATKKIAEIKSKFGMEGMKKKEEEKQLKHKNELAQKKIDEKSKKKTKELAEKTASEGKNKDSEEKALKTKHEKKAKAAVENSKKAGEERQEKQTKEDDEKKKRESALKKAAKRRIEEEQAAKGDKRKAMQTSAEMAGKKAEERTKKAEEESKNKLKEEVDLKKTREKKEKDAREVVTKQSQEVVRKTTREHKDKIEQEKSSKAFTEKQHKEKRTKAKEKTTKILEGLKDYNEQLAKARKVFAVKRKAKNDSEKEHKKFSTKSSNLSKVAKELATKIKGPEEKEEDPETCDLGKNVANIKKKGLLKASEGDCNVSCDITTQDVGLTAECKIDGEKKPDCQSLMYTRMQSLSSSLMAEFDAYKKCTMAKKSGPSGKKGHSREYMLGEAVERAIPKDAKDGVEVGDYIYSLKDLQDMQGTVNVGQAMDLLMKCNRNGASGRGRDEDELGESYSPAESQNYNVAKKTNEAPGSNDGEGNPPKDCMTSSIENTIENIMPPKTEGCDVHCSTGGIEYEAYTSECSGSGKVQCFVTTTETYHRSIASSFLSWKVKCAKYHGESTFALLKA